MRRPLRICFVLSLESCRNSALVVVAWPWQRALTPSGVSRPGLASLLMGLTSADGLTPAPCASNVRFPNAAVRAADTGQPMRGGYCHSGPMRRGLGAFGGSISLTVHSGRSSTSYFKACGTLACSAHMISSLLMYTPLQH